MDGQDWNLHKSNQWTPYSYYTQLLYNTTSMLVFLSSEWWMHWRVQQQQGSVCHLSVPSQDMRSQGCSWRQLVQAESWWYRQGSWEESMRPIYFYFTESKNRIHSELHWCNHRAYSQLFKAIYIIYYPALVTSVEVGFWLRIVGGCGLWVHWLFWGHTHRTCSVWAVSRFWTTYSHS